MSESQYSPLTEYEYAALSKAWRAVAAPDAAEEQDITSLKTFLFGASVFCDRGINDDIRLLLQMIRNGKDIYQRVDWEYFFVQNGFRRFNDSPVSLVEFLVEEAKDHHEVWNDADMAVREILDDHGRLIQRFGGLQ